MGRPRKITLDFFLHDAHASSDIKLRRLERRHGCEGYAVYFKLLEQLCQNEGMRLDISDPGVLEILSDDFNLRDSHHLLKILQDCVEFGLFDKQLWESERIVFSHGLQKRYLARLEERKQDAERKRRKKDAERLEERIAEIAGNSDGNSESKIQNSKTDPDTYTNTDRSRVFHPENPGIHPENQTETRYKQEGEDDRGVLEYPNQNGSEIPSLTKSSTPTKNGGGVPIAGSDKPLPKTEGVSLSQDVTRDSTVTPQDNSTPVQPARFNATQNFESRFRATQQQTLAEWRSSPMEFRPELYKAVEEAYPELYRINGKANTPKIHRYLVNLEGKGEFETLIVLLRSGQVAVNPACKENPHREQWLEEMREKGRAFYHGPTGFDEEKRLFFEANFDEVFNAAS